MKLTELVMIQSYVQYSGEIVWITAQYIERNRWTNRVNPFLRKNMPSIYITIYSFYMKGNLSKSDPESCAKPL